MGLNVKTALSMLLAFLAWAFLLSGGTLVLYGIYGRFAVRVAHYGPANIWDVLVPLFWVLVVVGGFLELKGLAKKAAKPSLG